MSKSTSNTPSETPPSGCATPPITAPAPNNLASTSFSPLNLPLQSLHPAHPADSAIHQHQSHPPQQVATLAQLLQPLPRGQDPKAKPNHPPPTAHWERGTQDQDTWEEPASAAPIVHTPDPQTQLQIQYGRPPPEPAYLRGGHLLGGYNTARYAGHPTAHPKFNAGGRLMLLTNASNLQAWVQQISYIARSLSCFDELTKRFTSFPQSGTVQLFICETRFTTAFRVLEGSISGPVWAYMRVLGFSSIPEAGESLMSPTPADCFEFAKLAASRMAIPGTPEQPLEERKCMVREILTAQATDYPGERVYKKGVQWLRLACDSLIKQGDYELAESLYEPLPDWAPKPPGYVEPTAIAEGKGSPTDQNGSCATPDVQFVHSPLLNGASNAKVAPYPPKLVPEQLKSSKRKRAKKDTGLEPTDLTRPSAGTHTVA